MDITTFEASIREAARRVHNIIIKEAIDLYKSGGIDPDAYHGKYQLPKIILNVVLPRAVAYLGPLTAADEKDVDNLRHF